MDHLKCQVAPPRLGVMKELVVVLSLIEVKSHILWRKIEKGDYTGMFAHEHVKGLRHNTRSKTVWVVHWACFYK